MEKLAVIYARYSDKNQTYQSIEGQLKVCNKFAKENGYTVLGEPYVDEAQTGKNDNRNYLRKMLNDSKKKLFDTIIVYAFDRFGRDLLQSLLNEKKLNDNDVTVLSATENNENTPAGRMQRNIHMTFAQYFSEELAQKTSRGMSINADNYYSNGGTTPLGYRLEKINPDDDKSKKRYVIDENAAPIVHEIYTKYASGQSMKQIVIDLNNRNIKNASGKKFLNTSLHNLLTNRKYLGLYIYGKTEIPGGMPQIIEQDLFDKVGERMRLNKTLPGRTRAKAEYLLTSKLFCGYCKAMMTGHSSNQISTKGKIFNYYKCKNQGGGKPCKKKMIHKDYIEDVVVNKCREILTPKNIQRIAKEIMKIAKSYDDRTEVNRLVNLIKTAQEEKENQMATLRSCKDDLVKEMIIEDLSRIGAELKNLEIQLEIEKSRRESVSETEIIKSLTRLAEGDINDIVYRKSLIRLLVNKIFLYDDKYTITFNTGDEEVEITDSLLEDIENKILCGSKVSGSQKEKSQTFKFVTFLRS